MSRRAKKAPEEVSQAWLLTYGDMVTLLMAFFVMLFAVSSVKADKFEAFLSGLGHFDNPASKGVAFEVVPVGNPVAPLDSERGALPNPQSVDGLDDDIDRPAVAAEVERLIEEHGLDHVLSLQPDARGIAIAVSTDEVLFATGSADLTDRGRALIALVARVLQPLGNDLLVEGHADNQPLDGSYSNWNLSTDRAVAVVDVLVDDHLFDPRRITAAGRGEFDPIDEGSGSAARRRNRRVEIIVVGEPAANRADPGLDGGGAFDPGVDPDIDTPG